MSLVGRARAIAPLIGRTFEDVRATLGPPSRTGGSTVPGRDVLRYDVGGDLPGEVALEAEGGRVVLAAVTQDDVDAFAVVGALEGEMQDWLGTLDPMNVDHGYYFWEKDDWTFTAQAAGESMVELVVEAK